MLRFSLTSIFLPLRRFTLHLFTAYFLTLTSTQPPMACSMMLFPVLHIPSIPSSQLCHCSSPHLGTSNLDVGAVLDCAPRAGFAWLFPSTMYVRACRPITPETPVYIRVDANYYHIHNSSGTLVFSLAVSSRFQCLPGRGLHPRALGAGSISGMVVWLYGPTIILLTKRQYKWRNICNRKRGTPGPITKNMSNPRHLVRWSALP